MTFNLASFSRIEDLFGALHQVRDRTLSGRPPVVLWDEFDGALANQQFGWLKYFLAPMQDGEFQEGTLTHAIGRAIFVFAGGIYPHASDFLSAAAEHSREKAPDFASRLRGYLDVPDISLSKDRARTGTTLRRAVLLRSYVERHAKHLLVNDRAGPGSAGKISIDEGVLNAFLSVPAYKHGARSMEAIVTMSTLQGRTSYDRSSLPPRSQIALHVDSDAFFQALGSSDS